MKKTVFWVSLVGTASGFLTSGLPMLTFWCGDGNYRCWDKFDIVSNFLLVFIPIFLLSLITYKMRDEVFRAWWNFARWWVPVIILVTYLQSTQHRGGGVAASIGADFDRLLLSFFYAVLVLVSLWRIVKKYRQLKRAGK